MLAVPSMVLVIVILSIRPSLHLSRVLCGEMKERTADILIPHEKGITLVCWYQRRLVCDVPFHWNLRLNWPTFFEKRRLKPVSAYNVWTVRVSEKCSIIVNRKPTTCFLMNFRWTAYATPNIASGRLTICDNRTFFAGWDIMSRSQSAFFKLVGHLTSNCRWKVKLVPQPMLVFKN